MDPNELRKKAAALAAQAKAIQAELDSPDCDLTADQRAKREASIDDLIEQATAHRADADQKETDEKKADERRKALAAIDAASNARPPVRGSGEPSDTGLNTQVGEPGFTRDPMKGFSSPREYFSLLIDNKDVHPKAVADERLKYLATAGTDEQQGGSDPYGGFLVPEGMSPNLLSTAAEGNPLLGSVTRVPMDAPVVKFLARTDKNHTTSVSGGLTVSRRQETGGISSSRMEMERVKLEASGLFGLAYATEELMDDSPRSVSALLASGFSEEFPSKTFSELLNGTGVGELEGILNAPATIAVAKEGGQSADTIVANNILKMRTRAWNYGRSVWYANHDTYLQLIDLQVESSNNAGAYWLFRPGNGVDVPDTLLGRPIIFTEYAETLGDKGDIGLVDMSQYLYGLYQPLKSAESMHVRFLNHERAFKFWLRDAGACWWRSALTPKKGANTLSPFVTLAARA